MLAVTANLFVFQMTENYQDCQENMPELPEEILFKWKQHKKHTDWALSIPKISELLKEIITLPNLKF